MVTEYNYPKMEEELEEVVKAMQSTENTDTFFALKEKKVWLEQKLKERDEKDSSD